MGDSLALVRVTRQAVKVRRGAGHVFTKPKTKTGVREVPIPVWLYQELMRLKLANEARARVVGAGYEDRGLAFPSRMGGPMSESWLRDMFARLLKRAGLPLHYTPRSLRYTYNTLLYIGGVQDKPRCALMGHAREDFNKKVCVKVLPQMFVGVAETLERQIFGAVRTSFAPREGERLM